MMDIIPSSRRWVVAGMVAILVTGLAVGVQEAGKTGWDLLAMAMAGLCWLAFLALLWRWGGLALAEMRQAWRAGSAVTPYLEILRAASHLTPEQAALVPRMDEAGIAYDVRDEDLRLYLVTPGVLIPWDQVERFLRVSSFTELFHIGWTSDKTPERRYIQAWSLYGMWLGKRVRSYA